MILEFQIENFGPIKERQTLSFEATKDTTLDDYYCVEVSPGVRVLKLGILYGPNASGKTTFIKAFEFLVAKLILDRLNFIRSRMYPPQKDDKLDFLPFQFNEKSSHYPSFFQLVFYVYGVRYTYSITFNQDFILEETLHYSPNGRLAEVYIRTTDTERKLSKIKFGSTIEIDKYQHIQLEGNTLSNVTVLGAIGRTNVNIEPLSTIRNWFREFVSPSIYPRMNLDSWTTIRISNDSDRFDENYKSEFKKTVVEIIKKADVQISDVEVKKEVNLRRYKITFNHQVIDNQGNKNTYHLDYDNESMGTQRYYGLSGALAIMLSQPTFLAIDELESSLHPELMKHFIMTFLANSTQSQMLVTTHNLSFLDDPDILRKDAIWFTEKQNDGATKLYSLSDFDTKTIRKGTSILNAYKIGKFGAIPNLGSIYLEKSTPKNESK
jgi:AAA15 family ATPase/GTPase